MAKKKSSTESHAALTIKTVHRIGGLEFESIEAAQTWLDTHNKTATVKKAASAIVNKAAHRIRNSIRPGVEFVCNHLASDASMRDLLLTAVKGTAQGDGADKTGPVAQRAPAAGVASGSRSKKTAAKKTAAKKTAPAKKAGTGEDLDALEKPEGPPPVPPSIAGKV